MLLQNFFSTVQAAVVRRRLLAASGSRMSRDEDALVGYMPFGDAMSYLDSLLVHPGVREWWDRHQGIYRQEFVEVVKERLAHLGHAARQAVEPDVE
jgi:hypothetical protein